MPEIRQRNDVETQTLPMKETSSQASGYSTETFLGNRSAITPVQSLNDSKKHQSEFQRHETWQQMTMEMTTFPSPKNTTSQIEEQLLRDDTIRELYLPLSSTIVIKRKEEMLYVPLDFENGLTIDALADSGAYVGAIAQSELDRIKRQAPANIFKTDDPPSFQNQVANGQSEKPMSTTTHKVDIGNNIL